MTRNEKAAQGPTPTFWAAPDLAKAGYPVFPLKANGKEPSVPGGFYAGTTDISQVAEWITEGHGHHNIGFATGLPSGVVVVEADTAKAYARMEAKCGPPHVKSRRGGHWYFKHPKDGKVVSRSGFEPGLDSKGDGGLVVAPPSTNKTWTRGIPEKATLPTLPPVFRDKLRTGGEATIDFEAERNGHHATPIQRAEAAGIVARHVEDLKPGERHEHLRHACGVLLTRTGREDAQAILEGAWRLVGGELAERAPREVPNTLRTTADAIAEGNATGVPSMEKLTPGLFGELERALGWVTHINVGGKSKPTDPSGASEGQTREWPEMDDAAYRGLLGSVVETVEPHTEGDPVAVLTGAIVAFGNAYGRGPYMQIGATKHRTNLFVGHVGATAKGRKGSAWNPVKDIMHAADRRWAEDRISSGLSSGEGLIAEVRDPVQVPDKDGTMKTVDQGVKDKRLLVMEGELSQVLKVMKREGNTLSPVMRNAWDGETLRTMVKHSPLRASDPHVSIAGHITLAELTRHLTETEMANGLANRFQWFLVKRSKSLPFGGEWHTADLAPITRKLAGILEFATPPFRMEWAVDARALWREAYEVLTEDRAGMFGAVTARAEAQALRLAMIYALADYSYEIRRTHVESALAVWEYAEASALYIFGDATGDPDADKVLAMLRGTEDGLTRTEIRDLFNRNKGQQEIDRIREALSKAGKVRVVLASEEGSKKPVERWFAA